MPPFEPQGRPPPRPIKRLLVANRGEIAARILSAAREYAPAIETFVLSTKGDTGHTLHSSHVITLDEASSYLNIGTLLDLIKKNQIDAVHPGYGFLSESAEFAKRAWKEAGAVVVGPGWEVLERTGDKLRAKVLARECQVPVLEATMEPTGDVQAVKRFSDKVGLPVIIKAVDGGGGRGIRLVRRKEDLESFTKRAIAESPSKKVFVERAAADGFRHVEVQIVGDGTGNVRHLWERECSIQRRYQKIIEVAPSTIEDRQFVAQIIAAAVRMAEKIRYFSLGTFEFLANPQSKEFFFLEVNPRLQVEHTITESISQVDIVQTQLQLQQGATLSQTALSHISDDAATPPPLHSIQLRICAENAQTNFSLSIGRISSFNFPSGHGIRVDTALVQGHESVVSADFDSLIAKVIVTASSWDAAVRKANRALQDTRIVGVHTNLDVLRAVIASEAFLKGQCDIAWLEANMAHLLESGKRISSYILPDAFFTQNSTSSAPTAGLSSSTVLFRKGDAWNIKLTPTNPSTTTSDATDEPANDTLSHHLKFERVTRNEFPNALHARIAYATNTSPTPQSYDLTLTSTTSSSSALSAEGAHRKGNPRDASHVMIPFAGTLVEVLVDEGDAVERGDVICIVRQMKMELEVRSAAKGRVKWVFDVEDGEEVAEGDLVAELEGGSEGEGEGEEEERARSKL